MHAGWRGRWRVVLGLGLLCVPWSACRSPRLVAAPAAATPARGAGAPSTARRLAHPFLAPEGGADRGPYGRPVSEADIARIEQAVRLRLEARRARRCAPTAAQRAERTRLPTGTGDEYRGKGPDLRKLADALARLLGGGR